MGRGGREGGATKSRDGLNEIAKTKMSHKSEKFKKSKRVYFLSRTIRNFVRDVIFNLESVTLVTHRAEQINEISSEIYKTVKTRLITITSDLLSRSEILCFHLPTTH